MVLSRDSGTNSGPSIPDGDGMSSRTSYCHVTKCIENCFIGRTNDDEYFRTLRFNSTVTCTNCKHVNEDEIQ